MTAVAFSRGAAITDNFPKQRVAPDFAAFIAALDADRAKRKGQGYICGPLNGAGRRCAEGALSVRFLAVDLDRIDAKRFSDLRTHFAALSACAWPTHSSTPAAPRERVIIELSREATRDECVTIGAQLKRNLAALFGGSIDVDKNTFRPEQPSYLPPVGAVLQRFTGEPLNVEQFLAAAREAGPTDKPSADRPGAAQTGSSALVRRVAAHPYVSEVEGVPGNVLAALAVLDPDDRATWVAAGHHLKATGADWAFETWLQWSQQSPKFEPGDEERWEGFNSGLDAGIYFLLKGAGIDDRPADVEAVEGWVDPKPADRRAISATVYKWRPHHLIPPRGWLFRDHYIRKFVVATAGPPAVAKSSIALLDYVSMVVGRDLLTDAPLPNGPLRVWLYNTEDPREEVERRLAAICKHYGITAADIGDRLHLDTAREHKLVIAKTIDGRAVSVPRVVDELVDAIKARGIDVFGVDPLIHAHAVPENDNTGMGVVMEAWREVAERGDCCAELLHHIRKNGGAETSADDMRGAGAILGSVRSLRLVTTMSRDEAASLGVSEDKRGFYKWANPHGKASLVPPASRRDWYFMRSVDLLNATGTHPSDSVGVATRWTAPGAFDDVTLEQVREVWTAIGAADPLSDARVSVQSDGWIGKLIARTLGLDLDEAQGQIKQMIQQWRVDRALRVVDLRDKDGKARPVYVLGKGTASGGKVAEINAENYLD